MPTTKYIILLVFTILSTMAMVATAQTNNALGAKVFAANCTACHEGGANSFDSEKTLKPDALKKFGFNGVADVKKRVMQGAGVMPVFEGKLKAEEIDAVANYVWSQSQKGWK